MNRAAAWALVAALAAATALLLQAPLWACGLAAAASLAALRKGRLAFVGFLAITLPLHALLFAATAPGPDAVAVGPLRLGWQGALLGAAGTLRLAAILGVNLAALSWRPAGVLLDGLRLPPRATAFLGAVLIAAHDLGRDAVRLVDAQRLAGRWPRGLGRKAKAAALLVPPLAVLALRRAGTRSEALRLAGHGTGPSFAPLVAMTALAVAGRLALVAVPNVSLTYVVVFAAGLLFGPRVGALSGLVAMAFTDLLLSGLHLAAFANAPAMALVGLLGGALRRVDFAGATAADRWAGRLLAGACGLVATIAFSVAADAATWAVVPEFRGTPGALRTLVLAGLAFNLVPAAINALLFAAVVGPLAAAARHAGALPTRSTRSSGGGEGGGEGRAALLSAPR